MTEYGSARGRLWLVLLAAFGAALVSVLALPQRDGLARADARDERGRDITLERSGAPDFQRQLDKAITRDGPGPAIVGGTAVPDGKYPFMAVLIVRNSAGGTGLCGGSLIDADSVLTAGHCLVNAVSVDLAVGRTVISQNQGQVRFATAAYLHPNFNPNNNFSYDAAVLKLNAAVAGVGPIRLSAATQNALETPGRRLTVSGWGTTSEGGSTSDRMREVSVPVVRDAAARRAYASQAPILRYFPSLMVAAGVRGKDSCQGDSGGPLFKPGAPRTQVGIVSYGRGCARAGFPGAYTEVNHSGVRTFIVNAAAR